MTRTFAAAVTLAALTAQTPAPQAPPPPPATDCVETANAIARLLANDFAGSLEPLQSAHKIGGEALQDDIAWYLASGEGRDKAGGYAIQGLASRFNPAIRGSYSNVVGLPVACVDELLRTLLASRL